MAQLNLNMTAQLEKDLAKYMKHKGIQTKSDAIRMALREAVEQISAHKVTDFQSWLGAGLKAPTKKKNKFKTEDDIWNAG